MRSEYRDILRAARAAGYEHRVVHTSGDDPEDARRRERMMMSGWEWTHSVVGERKADVAYHFRRAIVKGGGP